MRSNQSERKPQMTYLPTTVTHAHALPGSILPSPGRDRLRAALAKLVGPRDCQRLLDSAGENGVLRWPAAELASACGIAHRSAERVVAARELHLDQAMGSSPHLTCAADVLRHLPLGFATWETEVVLTLALSGANHLLAVVVVARGGGSSAALEARDVLTPLVRIRAASFILVHNHPAGDPAPSKVDIRLTNRLAEAGRVLSIPMVDHIIVASSGIISLCEAGLLETNDELRDKAGAMDLGRAG